MSFKDGTRSSYGIVCDIMHLEGAECIAIYESDFYTNMPAVTINKYGDGYTYYIGTNMDEEGIAKVMSMAAADRKVTPVINYVTKLEVTCKKQKVVISIL